MAEQWMGFTISIDCGPMGVYQGVVTAVVASPQSVTLSRVFHNGVPHTSPSIVISANDIKDLTIIAAPLAQLDPVVELKKPIPTRPGRNAFEGSQNFHSQPAPPRALHLNDDPQKAVAALLEYEQKLQQARNGAKHHAPVPQQAPLIQPSSVERQLRQQTSSAAAAVQLSSLHAALPEALRIDAASQATTSAASAQTTGKLSAAQVVSQRAQQAQQAQRTQQTQQQGGFKMTSALAGHGPSAASCIEVSSQRSRQAAQSLLQSTLPLPIHLPACLNNCQAFQAIPLNASLFLPLNSAAQSVQSLFRGPAPAPASASHGALPRPQGAACPVGSPQRSARSVAQVFAGAAAGLGSADGYGSVSGDGNRTPNRRDRHRQRQQARDEACFGSPANNGFDQDFDFEKNLALFDKQAVYDEIAVQRPDLVQPAGDQRRQQNYRHDQNILVNNRRIPTIIVPTPAASEYVTDEGLVIPSVRPDLLRSLHQKAHDFGFTFDRQSEVFARCATEMSLQLLGGAHRLNPSNAHQWPTVVVMVGPHSQGTAGVMCARQLESQGISTVTLVVNETSAPAPMKRELNIYKCSGGPVVSSIEQLPETADLVIMALAGHLQADVANSLEYGRAGSWASNKRASVLALDPPPVGTPGIITKFALAPTLPLTYTAQNGKIYLCNLGIPCVVFKEMGIRYRSPFGSKFVIPLHPNDD
ncbi:hypothetical protein ONE63_003172 [Megalurothrips usitatus]|uniref:Enhancer of mRNA-decapping protein 3 n=1 Tax=Megalurothrips usitatus TaxID=439358 RepID=A0AAV7X9Z7_9NEOP|nr:hypothetical protein ONE63_003172 [Megalurothrips usitatus]